MDKDLKQYERETASRIELIEDRWADAKQSQRISLSNEAKRLYGFHIERVRDFQHERLIHLLVTFFFGGLLLLSIAGGLYALLLAADPSGPMLNILAWTLCPLLFITEIFYVRHYYFLENGVQALYGLSRKLQAIIESSDNH